MAEIDQLFMVVESYNEMTVEQLQVCVKTLPLVAYDAEK